MLWKLRLLWYRVDKAALAFAAFFGLMVGALAFAAGAVFTSRDEQRIRVQAFHERSVECLARNIYYEARGEPAAGQFAVAEVTMNRVASPLYPRTVCDVVYQRAAFSWTLVGPLPGPEGDEWESARRVAEAVYYGKHIPGVEGALFYHATYVKPAWSKQRQRVARIGRHVFYR